MAITPIYAALLAFIFIGLSLLVISRRRSVDARFGDDGDASLLRRMRVQSNFAEYVPFCLLLMALAELQNLPGWVVHLAGMSLLTGRLVHAFGVGRAPEITGSRTVGLTLTFAAMIIAAVANLQAAVFHA